MRTIKFRGKDIENEQQWRYGSLITYPNGASVIVEFDNDGNELSYDVDADTVGQFTGLYDKNGKEIYEGDIIVSDEYSHARHYVRYLDDEAMFIAMIMHSSLQEWCYIRQSWIDKFDKKVLCNIHDNPELLKGGNHDND